MKKIYIYTLATLTLWGAASCKKPNDFGKTNIDPGATSTPVVSALLASAELSVANYASTNAYSINSGYYAQYFSESQYPGTSLYTNPQTDFTGTYNGTLYDLQNVINLNQDKNSVAVAKILQSYVFWVLTDSFGDVPYSQALLGIKSITPAYDKQEDIYKGLLTTLTAAVASMDGGTVPGDLYYGGSAAKWKKMANSLKLLIAIQASRAPGNDFAKAAFVEASASALITDNADNFTLVYPGGGSYNSPWYNLYNGRTDVGESKTMTDMTATLNDGRTVPFGGSFSDPKQTTGGIETSNIGIPAGLDRTPVLAFITANPTWALVLRADYRTNGAGETVPVITASEVLLALAEGANIGWIPVTNMVTNYQDGIKRSFEQWGVDAPPAGYFTNAKVAISAAATGYKTTNGVNIAVQQWIASYPNGHMAWNVWRKTSSPALVPTTYASNTSKQIVRRFTYAIAESTTNPNGVKAAVARETGLNPGTDSQDNLVWWDPGLGK
ncbi:SusD/RagB family nutrient-binding outer membrane lipoprotein [Mucilaginibacter sp.]|uniref:SusD/RagB family nutrient-binding outer membrane lipoprotein n=1 Tax=Mucilaginibacter sp. TaxID=1882438 RepID=UPI002606A884|nr:SusD/RagB family nutrient-binding outer membrane lipoprotein [Mucilaginibacter sp.]MDB4918421.1 hypothetical protein [Mucilaginibacter sp.]